MNQFSKLFNSMDFHTIAKTYTPKNLAENLSFDEGRILAFKILFCDEWDGDLNNYATELLNEIRKHYEKEWTEDWKNDVFLGDACFLDNKYDEEYAAYKRAFEKASSAPPSLLLCLASCYSTFNPPITADEAEKLTLKALEKELSLRGVVLIRGIYKSKNDQIKFDYWDKVYNGLKGKKTHSSEGIWPDLLSKDTPGGYTSPLQ